MAFIVETGSGSTTANAYISVANADTFVADYASAAHQTAWDALTNDEKEHAIRDATRYLDQRYGERWLGYRANETQRLDWPRIGVEDRDGYVVSSTALPNDLVEATAQLSILSVVETNGLWPNLSTPGRIKRKKSKAGPVEQDIEYVGGASQTKRFPRVDALVSSLIDSGGSMLTRA